MFFVGLTEHGEATTRNTRPRSYFCKSSTSEENLYESKRDSKGTGTRQESSFTSWSLASSGVKETEQSKQVLNKV